MHQHPTAILTRLRQLCPDWCVGVAGRNILLHHLQTILSTPEHAGLAALVRDIAAWRIQLFPWDLQSTHLYLPIKAHSAPCPSHPRLPPAIIPSDDPTRSMQSIGAQDPESITLFWRKQPRASILDPVLISESCLFALQRGERDLVDMILECQGLERNHPVILHLRAVRAFYFEPPETTLSQISVLPDNFSWLRTYLRSEIMIRHDKNQSIKNLISLWREMPWHVNLTLKLHDLLHPGPHPAHPGSDTAVCIYSWNNADLLKQTLHSLSQSNLGAASVLVLDNGSHDHTPDVISTLTDLLGQRLKTYRLPVNIGAPAARNWLLRHPEASCFRNIAFVDDDVIVPREWLGALIARKQSAPRHTVVGCRIMNQQPQESMQMADVNLLNPTSDGDFLLANTGVGELNMGLHAYSRPCLSVTGCCHLLDRQHAVDLGGFDLRFGPSQFDDFDLDLRNALHGGHAIFAGQTAIRHCQRSSLAQADSEAKREHLFGNRIKLNTKFSPEQKAELMRRNHELLWNDLLAKTRALENA